jgi:tRNA U34 5-carboxymethylaminomethyl modifying enzyme MnmG/GidA
MRLAGWMVSKKEVIYVDTTHHKHNWYVHGISLNLPIFQRQTLLCKISGLNLVNLQRTIVRFKERQ